MKLLRPATSDAVLTACMAGLALYVLGLATVWADVSIGHGHSPLVHKLPSSVFRVLDIMYGWCVPLHYSIGCYAF